MGVVQRKLTNTFKQFFKDQKSSGIVLIVCTIVSLIITNSPVGENYLKLWQFYVAGLSVEHWINDGLMAIFFLLIGLELERELYKSELSHFKNALLPICAAIGGIALPALMICSARLHCLKQKFVPSGRWTELRKVFPVAVLLYTFRTFSFLKIAERS